MQHFNTPTAYIQLEQETVLCLQQLTVTVEPFRVGAPSDTV